MNYNELDRNTPRLVILYRNVDGQEAFQWGEVGINNVPVLSMIGAIIRTQSELFFKAGEDCPEQAFCLVYDVTNRSFNWFIHQSIPREPLCGMLETIKALMVNTKLAREHGNQQRPILGPDGRPYGR